MDLPSGSTAWTPELAECVPPGRYAWAVAAVVADGARRWSKPALFRFNATPPAREPPAVQREVVYAHGKYVLYGDGVSQPWQWVWVPSAPASPPAAPAPPPAP